VAPGCRSGRPHEHLQRVRLVRRTPTVGHLPSLALPLQEREDKGQQGRFQHQPVKVGDGPTQVYSNEGAKRTVDLPTLDANNVTPVIGIMLFPLCVPDLTGRLPSTVSPTAGSGCGVGQEDDSRRGLSTGVRPKRKSKGGRHLNHRRAWSLAAGPSACAACPGRPARVVLGPV
jgi:hypothetical protein